MGKRKKLDAFLDSGVKTWVWTIPDEAYETIWDEVHRLAAHHPEWGTVSAMMRAVAGRLREGATIYRLTGSTGKLYDWLCEVVKEELGVLVQNSVVGCGENADG